MELRGVFKVEALARIGRVRMRAWLFSSCVAFAAMLILAPKAGAQEEHFDVLLYDSGDGNLRAGGVDVDFLVPELDTVVLEGELLGDTTSPDPDFGGEDPGFFSFSDGQVGLLPPPSDNLPGNATVTLDFLTEPTLGTSLSFWDDANGEWIPLPGSESIGFSVGAVDFGEVDGISEVLDIDLGDTSASGFLDDHPDYVLNFNAGTCAAGVYLLYGRASVTGLAGPSNPFWLVMGTLDECEETDTCTPDQEEFNEAIEEQIEAAIEYTQATLVPVPASIDIAPFRANNKFKNKPFVQVPVALLGSAEFDVTDVDTSTLAFGPAGAAPTWFSQGFPPADVNHDGSDDLFRLFHLGDTGIPVGTSQACLRGEMSDGTPFEGCDSITVVNKGSCGIGFELAFLLSPLMWLNRRMSRRA